MAGPKNPNDPTGGQVPPGSGYIPPQLALVANGASGGIGGIGAGVPLALMALAWSVNTGGIEAMKLAGGGTLRNIPLAAALMLIALVFGGLALALTALAGRQLGYVVETPLGRFKVYIGFSLLGLAAYGLALDFLALGLAANFHLAAIVGAVLQILALAVGIYCRVPAEKKKRAPSEGTLRPSTTVDNRA